MNEIILLVNFHGVGAKQIGMQYMMVKTDAVIPKPAKQELIFSNKKIK